MAWVATAIVGSTLIGGVVSSQASSQAASSAADATAASSQASIAQLDYTKQQQARWDSVFGSTQDNLASYYNHLDPNSIAAQNIVGIQQANQQAQKQIDRTLAQRGMQDSGLSASLMSQNTFAGEQLKAQALVNAPQQAAQQRSSFLGLGMGLESSLQNSVSNAYQQQSVNANNQYNAAIGQQTAANSSLTNLTGGVAQAAGYFFKPSATQAASSLYYDQQPGFIGPSIS